jgi:hypothetical protein
MVNDGMALKDKLLAPSAARWAAMKLADVTLIEIEEVEVAHAASLDAFGGRGGERRVTLATWACASAVTKPFTPSLPGGWRPCTSRARWARAASSGS